ncbi:site-specific integrase [Albimonas sp. CAU 1670]|uniref:site-specific integrase n=1 Tax=Albimonas sp. CAU 1670 TaxID=3032599 RepID=UPI0023DA3B8B|nr:site-specific integrase [Albimonas sp. CAU 1670]MDF2235106.1 site-specific integrase [Albimonas sp. CAU 1670]
MPTPTSAGPRPSSRNGAGPRRRPPDSADCSIGAAPHNLKPASRSLQSDLPLIVPNHLATDTSAILAARLLVPTGCRLNEIVSLKWSCVDLAERVLRLPDSKYGAKVVHLGQPAVELLRDAQHIEGNPWVIFGTLPGKRLSDLQPFWQRVRARAGVKDVRIPDLRHTFASPAVASSQGLPMIGKLLGHTQVQATARYAHLAAEPVRMAADAVAQNLRQSLGLSRAAAPLFD